jgi:hydroxyacylglutathione hydrolase
MWDSLQKLVVLPKDTLVYCAHEYTLSNAKFALHVEPGNQALARRAEEVRLAREQGVPTVRIDLGTGSATRSFVHSVIQSLSHSVIQSFIRMFTRPLMCRCRLTSASRWRPIPS